MKRKSIKTAVIIPLLITLLLGFAALVVTARVLSANIADRLTAERTTGASLAVQARLGNLEEQTRVIALALANSYTVTNNLREWNAGEKTQSRNNLLNYLESVARNIGVDSFVVRDADGYIVLQLHARDIFGERDNSPDSNAALEGRATTSYSSTSAIPLSLNTTVPINDNGEIIGTMTPVFFLHSNEFLNEFSRIFSAEITLYGGSTSIATTLLDSEGNRVIGIQAGDEATETVLNGGQLYEGEMTSHGVTYHTFYFPLKNVAGNTIAMFSVGFSTEYRASAMLQLSFTLLSISAALLLIIALIVRGIVSSSLRKLPVITSAAEAIALGDIDIQGLDESHENTANEVTKLERAFSKMIESFKKQAYILARVAEGDYTSKVEIRSEKDTINLAIEIMLNETLNVLNQVATAGVQVADGSKEIAAGAQTLADGAAQQSATVEQLSASMSEMAKTTKENAVMADRAANLAVTIKANAEKGSNQMTEMIDAVKEINQASQNISKVIKIIDDIAFQTNILALNAAVEAARAGQHGKGFAVVAEEVRNLAAKSAEAAKDTDEMISSSIEKAELGSRIAGETAASLEEIVAGIVESSKIVGDIARYSNEQSTSIAEIDAGINQVANVIHQNSATAEESAAASQEMSSQSKVLEELIMQFQLRGGRQAKK
ncbi:MAG: methyl-accepting chemotaxis protein [Oscillospiraceae bacterium]|nr:methyl-accepting chemotaxis protein [Oscillospiraceae bacterium]